MIKKNTLMRRAPLLILSLLFITYSGQKLSAQNIKNFYYIIKKDDIESGKLKLIYRDPDDSVRLLQMCYSKLKAEDLHLENGVPSFHFERIPSSQFDSDPNCISNNTLLGQFEIDVRKRKIGDPNVEAKIPLHANNWNASLTLYKIRFAQGDNPVLAVSDPASMLISVIYGHTFGYTRVDHESLTNYYLTIGPFAGITSANLNPDTVTDPKALTKEQNNVAFSYGITTVLGRNNFGFSFSLGADISLGQNSSLWLYQNKPWVGIGVSSNLGMF